MHLLRYLAKAAFVTKRPGNPFPHLISIGRSKACDITVSVESISKVHGYFVTDGEGWSFTDHGSTNGSKVGPHVLGKGEKRPLEEGVTLKLGLDFSLRFHTPRGLFFAARV
ncbi:MAG: FHA domain-containing protein [Acidobacteriota bacterium]